jgi:hypothetical protein
VPASRSSFSRVRAFVRRRSGGRPIGLVVFFPVTRIPVLSTLIRFPRNYSNHELMSSRGAPSPLTPQSIFVRNTKKVTLASLHKEMACVNGIAVVKESK